MTAAEILLVEDDRDVREALIEALEDEGYAVLGAHDGMDALEILRSHDEPPRLILLDLMMPRMSGFELHEALSQDPVWSRIPIVVLTADAQGHAKARDLGARAYFRKPLSLASLFDVLDRLLAS